MRMDILEVDSSQETPVLSRLQGVGQSLVLHLPVLVEVAAAEQDRATPGNREQHDGGASKGSHAHSDLSERRGRASVAGEHDGATKSFRPFPKRREEAGALEPHLFLGCFGIAHSGDDDDEGVRHRAKHREQEACAVGFQHGTFISMGG